jgi:hypothetical protein
MLSRTRLLAVVGTALAVFTLSAPAHAQATRTFVSGVGDDLNPCSRTAPCKTFAGAFSKTSINGEIDCLDPGGFGTLTITKSITIDCSDSLGSVLASGTNGVTISIAINANDPFRTVRLRGLSINGSGASGTIGTRTGVRGVRILDAAVVEIEDSVIFDFTLAGIQDARTSAGGKLLIRNTVVRDVTGTGIAAGGAGLNNVSIENVHSVNNGFGIAAGTGNRVDIKRSVFSGNTTGVEADFNGQVGMDDSMVSGNTTGLSNSGIMLFANSTVAFNNTGIAGTTTSFGNNRLFANGAVGTVPTLGAASTDHGQQ